MKATIMLSMAMLVLPQWPGIGNRFPPVVRACFPLPLPGSSTLAFGGIGNRLPLSIRSGAAATASAVAAEILVSMPHARPAGMPTFVPRSFALPRGPPSASPLRFLWVCITPVLVRLNPLWEASHLSTVCFLLSLIPPNPSSLPVRGCVIPSRR